MMNIVHLTSSPFFGGPERQMLGLALHLPEGFCSRFLLFAEGGRHRALLEQVQSHGFEAEELIANTPRLPAMVREVAGALRRLGADVLCCHGYKADLVGLAAARRAGVPVLAVSHGWTACTGKVRIYDALDRMGLYWMDRVVCVSQAQAARVRASGVPAARVEVVRNAIAHDETDDPDPIYRHRLHDFFPETPRVIVAAAGRLSPEKGFDVLVRAAATTCRQDSGVGFVLFGDGPLRTDLARLVARLGLERRFILAGFRADVRRFLPFCDLTVLPSYTEGLPVIALESLAAGVPVVATAVGGTPEVIEPGVNGQLVPPGDPARLAQSILETIASKEGLQALGLRGRQLVRAEFAFETQSRRYQAIFGRLCEGAALRRRPSPVPSA